MAIQPNVLGRNVSLPFGSAAQGEYPEMFGARHAYLTWKGTTVGNGATEIFLNGQSGKRLTIDSTTNGVWQLGWQAVAYDTTTPATSNVFFGQCGFTSISGTVAIVANSTNTKMPTAGTLALALTADNTNKAAIFTATGITAETVYWQVDATLSGITALGWRS